MTRYEEFEDHRIKHMEMVQAVIGRLGNDSFLVKGWAITVAGVFLGLAINSKQWELAAASVIPTLFFWGLDTHFLRAERLFRVLYDQIREGANGVEAFFMGATAEPYVDGLTLKSHKQAASRFRTFWRPTLYIFYGGLMVSGVLVGAAICRS